MRKPIAILIALAMIAACEKPELPTGPGSGTEEHGESGTTDPDTPRPKPGDDDPKPTPGPYFLPVVQTTDIHGYMVTVENGITHYRLGYIAKKADDIRHGGDILLLDGGDLFQGASISNMLDGWPVYTAIDMMGYDAVALGNHEFDWGWGNLVDPDATLPDYTWKGSSYQNKVPVVCANLYQYGSRVSATKDYMIVEKCLSNGTGSGTPLKIKVGIVGFATNYSGSIMTSKFTGMGFTILEDYTIAESIAANLESTGQCDATVLLVHGAAPAAAASLSQNSAIDLVLGGHSHRYESGVSENGIPYIQGGCNAERYAYAELRFHLYADGALESHGVGNQQIMTVDSSRDYISDYVNPQVREVSDYALEAISAELNSVIGYITVDATKNTINGSGGRASTMGNWMCDITRMIGDADVSFVNSGGIRTTVTLNGQPTQDITVAKVYEMFPFDNAIYVYSISYADLLALLEYSVTSGGKGLLSQMTGIDCYYTSRNTIQKLVKDGTTIYRNGAWTGDWASRNLTLAVSEYLATTERTDYTTGKPNLLPEWNNTSRLLHNKLIDNENAVRVLKYQASLTGGFLPIDTSPHYILVE